MIKFKVFLKHQVIGRSTKNEIGVPVSGIASFKPQMQTDRMKLGWLHKGRKEEKEARRMRPVISKSQDIVEYVSDLYQPNALEGRAFSVLPQGCYW